MSNTPTVSGWLDQHATTILAAVRIDPDRLARTSDPFCVPEPLRPHYAAAIAAVPLRDLADASDHAVMWGEESSSMERLRAGEAVIAATGGDRVPEPRAWNLSADRRIRLADEALTRHGVDVGAWRAHQRLWRHAVELANRQARTDRMRTADDQRHTCRVGGHVDASVFPRVVPSFTRAGSPLGSGPRLCDEHAAACAVELGRRHIDADVRTVVDQVAPDSVASTPTPADVKPRRLFGG